MDLEKRIVSLKIDFNRLTRVSFIILKIEHARYSKSSNVTFDSVLMSLGDAFSERAGIFTAPQSGLLYHFAFKGVMNYDGF